MPVDQRLCTAIALAEVTVTVTVTGRDVHRSGLAQPSEIPATRSVALRDGAASERSQLPGGSPGVTTNAWATQATVGPERFIRGRFYPLHRHAFVTPHVLDRSGWFATEAVAPTWRSRQRRRRWAIDRPQWQPGADPEREPAPPSACDAPR
jgi:hypothetical protein